VIFRQPAALPKRDSTHKPAIWQGRLPKKHSRLLVAAGITPPHSHSLERLVEVLQSEGLRLDGLRELRLKPLTRMNSETRYPQGDEAPADLFDNRDSDLALATAETVVNITAAELNA
jgi:HEPN domain-containing protein